MDTDESEAGILGKSDKKRLQMQKGLSTIKYSEIIQGFSMRAYSGFLLVKQRYESREKDIKDRRGMGELVG